jgi:anti-anti-sigma factor
MIKHMDLRYQIERMHDVVIVGCSGRMVRGSALDAFRRQIEELQHTRILVLNLSGVDHIDAGGLSVLVILRHWARKNAVRMNLVNPSPVVRELLETTRLTSVFEITSLEEALCILREHPGHPRWAVA